MLIAWKNSLINAVFCGSNGEVSREIGALLDSSQFTLHTKVYGYM